MKLNTPRAERDLCSSCERDYCLLPSTRKCLWILFTSKCLILIIRVWVKYWPRSASVQPLWLHKSPRDSRCCYWSESSDVPVAWNWEWEWGRGEPLGKFDNALSIFMRANVQASFDLWNQHKTHTTMPLGTFEGPTSCRQGLIPAQCLMNSANFLPWREAM